MISMRFLICFYCAIFGTIVQGMPRYRRQGQFAAQLGLGAAQSGNIKPGFQGSGGGNNLNNYHANGQLGIGFPIYSGGNNRPSVGIGGAISGSFGAANGQFSGFKPNYGVGVGVRIPFNGR